MKPFKAEFKLASPVILDSEYPLHLDGLIAAMLVREAQGMDAEDAWEIGKDLSGILDKTDGDDWVWKASRLIFTPKSGIMFMNTIRKSDPERFYEDLGKHWLGKHPSESKPYGVRPDTFKINTKSGQLRGYQWMQAFQWMESAVAYGVGDIDAVKHYIEQIRHIGKLSRNGYGRVSSVEVTKADNTDLEKWRLRYLPENEPGLDSVEYAAITACLRSPYWQKRDRQVVMEPII